MPSCFPDGQHCHILVPGDVLSQGQDLALLFELHEVLQPDKVSMDFVQAKSHRTRRNSFKLKKGESNIKY